jgi:hypothetical protein
MESEFLVLKEKVKLLEDNMELIKNILQRINENFSSDDESGTDDDDIVDDKSIDDKVDDKPNNEPDELETKEN